MRTETIVWTALPNGRTGPASVKLSVFVSPQLQTDEGGANPLLSQFPDFVDWPGTLASPALHFDVYFDGYPAVVVAPDLSGLSVAEWQALFDPTTTGVTSYNYQDYAGTTINSFGARQVHDNVSKLYGQLGLASGVLPPVLTFSHGQFLGERNVNGLVDSVANITRDSDEYALKSAVLAGRQFHQRPPLRLNSQPPSAPYVARAAHPGLPPSDLVVGFLPGRAALVGPGVRLGGPLAGPLSVPPQILSSK